MITGRDFTVKQEQHQDRLERAEKAQLIKQVMANRKKVATWLNAGRLVSGGHNNQPAGSTSHEVQPQAGG